MQYKLNIGESSVILSIPQTLVSGDPIAVSAADETKVVIWDQDLQAFRIQDSTAPALFRVVPLRSFERIKFAEDVETKITLETGSSPSAYATITMTPYYDGLAERTKQDTKKSGIFRSPIAGKVVGVLQSQGAKVEKGETILILEAMKMENKMLAPKSGVLSNLRVQLADSVAVGHVLFEIT